MKLNYIKYTFNELGEVEKFLLDKINSTKNEIKYLESIFSERGYKDICHDEKSLLGKAYYNLNHYNFLLYIVRKYMLEIIEPKFRFVHTKLEKNHQEKLFT